MPDRSGARTVSRMRVRRPSACSTKQVYPGWPPPAAMKFDRSPPSAPLSSTRRSRASIDER